MTSLKSKLLMLVLAAFGILHMLGASMIEGNSGSRPIEPMMLMQNVT